LVPSDSGRKNPLFINLPSYYQFSMWKVPAWPHALFNINLTLPLLNKSKKPLSLISIKRSVIFYYSKYFFDTTSGILPHPCFQIKGNTERSAMKLINFSTTLLYHDLLHSMPVVIKVIFDEYNVWFMDQNYCNFLLFQQDEVSYSITWTLLCRLVKK